MQFFAGLLRVSTGHMTNCWSGGLCWPITGIGPMPVIGVTGFFCVATFVGLLAMTSYMTNWSGNLHWPMLANDRHRCDRWFETCDTWHMTNIFFAFLVLLLLSKHIKRVLQYLKKIKNKIKLNYLNKIPSWIPENYTAIKIFWKKNIILSSIFLNV